MAEQIYKLNRINFSAVRKHSDAERLINETLGNTTNPWMTKYFASNLTCDEGEPGATISANFRWTVNTVAIEKSLRGNELLWETWIPRLGLINAEPVGTPAHFSFAADSSYYTPEAIDAVLSTFGSATVDTQASGGHFHHIYNMQAYAASLATFLLDSGLTAAK